jgi:hypothetical protein
VLGYAIVHAAGGHAGNDQQHLSVRRWTAPRAGTVTLVGKLTYGGGGCGDGVRGRIVSSRTGLAGEWVVHKTDDPATNHPEATTDLAGLVVEPGETLDFAVDCREGPGCDSYGWALDLKLTSPDGKPVVHSNAAADFGTPPATAWTHLAAQAWSDAFQRPPTTEELEFACGFLMEQIVDLKAAGTQGDLELLALTNLCQQLLSANEFLYVD